MKTRFYYLLEIQYLGFRYHGWQKQPNVITVQDRVLKTINWVLQDKNNKVIASGRTDAMVSAEQTLVEAFTTKEIIDLSGFLAEMNRNLPSDIRALSIKEVNKDFNIIQSKKEKEYHYYFSFGDKFHPYSAAFMTNIIGELDLPLMEKAACEFVGERDFFSYTFRPTPTTNTWSEIISCELMENTTLKASFLPKESYVVKCVGTGFKRNQIRLMMGMLFDLGTHQKTWDEFMISLDGSNQIKLSYIAPASGLHLHQVTLV